MSFCKECVKGVVHEGTATGRIEQIGGVTCYVATPTVEYPKDKAILFLPDLFGIELINNKLVIDSFAENGFYTVGIDYFDGDALPEDVINDPENFQNSVQKWLPKHGQSQTRPFIDKVVAALKENGITSFGATGYCFGGRYVFDLAFENIIKAAAVSHPSLLQVPEDLEKYKETSKAPLLINSCTIDPVFPHEAQEQSDKILGDFAPGYKREYFDGCTHGFAIRGDLSDPKVKAGKEGAFKSNVEWFVNKL